MMKKILLALLSITAFTVVKAQDNNGKKKPDYSDIDLSNRANDHFMLQYGYDGWLNTPDSVNPSGFSRHFNFYFMYDKAFKSNPHYSFGLGVGLGTSNIFFKNTYINLKSPAATLPFTNVSNLSVNHFDKYKLTTSFLEAPLELRFAGNPVTPDKGVKVAFGAKVGFLLKAYTKGKNAIDVTNNSIYGKNYIMKEVEKHYINTTRFALTGRLGYGFISVDGSYQLSSFLKSGAGGTFHPWSLGLTLSGL